jgi:hypothetical protein
MLTASPITYAFGMEQIVLARPEWGALLPDGFRHILAVGRIQIDDRNGAGTSRSVYDCKPQTFTNSRRCLARTAARSSFWLRRFASSCSTRRQIGR